MRQTSAPRLCQWVPWLLCVVEEVDSPNDLQDRVRVQQQDKALQQFQWWCNPIAQGICAYCQGSFAPHNLTIDHDVLSAWAP
jgi:hypothetical protein